ncbi:protein kinase, partial [Acinetobacter baumannii]
LRFDKEAKTAGLLNHQNMVAVFDYGLADSGEAFIVMEFVDGTSLAARLLQQKRLPVQQAVRIFIQICDGLSSAHGMGIVHRD